MEKILMKDLPAHLASIDGQNVYWAKTGPLKGHFKRISNSEGNITVDEVFKYSYTIKRGKVQFEFAIFPEKAASVEKVVSVFKLAKALLGGEVFINDIKIADYKTTILNDDKLKMFEILFRYWSNILQLERALGRHFIPADIVKNDSIDYESFNRLFRCLVNKKPYRFRNLYLKNLVITLPNDFDVDTIKKRTGVNFIFLKNNEKISFAGQEIPVYTVVGLFDLSISDITKKQVTDKGTEYVISFDENKLSYSSEMIFIDKNKADDYIKNQDAARDELSAAKVLNEKVA